MNLIDAIHATAAEGCSRYLSANEVAQLSEFIRTLERELRDAKPAPKLWDWSVEDLGDD